MQLKKWGILLLSIFIMTVSAGCMPKEESEQTETEKMELKESKKEADKKNSYLHDEVLELFPELKKVKAHLYEQYANVLAGEEVKNERPPIEFWYTGKRSFFPRMSMKVNFKENVTKEQMIEAVSYMIEQLKLLFPKEEQLQLEASALIAYTKDGVMKDELVYSNMGFVAKSAENSDEIYWEAKQAPDYEWTAFDPNSSDDKTISFLKMKESLEKMGIETTNILKNPNGSYIYTGAGLAEDNKLSIEYTATTDSSQSQNATFIMYMAFRQADITDEDFIHSAEASLKKCAMILYEDEEKGLEAVNFISENIDAVARGEKKSIVIGKWNLEFSRLENYVNLKCLNSEK